MKESDELLDDIGGIRFIAEESIVSQNGKKFSITKGERGPTVTPLEK